MRTSWMPTMRKESDKRKGTGTGRLKLGYTKFPLENGMQTEGVAFPLL